MSADITFTPQDFESYKAEVLRLADLLGIADWEISFEHGVLDDTTTAAEICMNNLAMKGHFRLPMTYRCEIGKVRTPEGLAKHEVLHLFLSELIFVASKTQDINDEMVVAQEHSIINRLGKVI